MKILKFLLTIVLLNLSYNSSAQYHGYNRPPVSEKKMKEYQDSNLKKSLDSLQKIYNESQLELSESTKFSIQEHLSNDRSITWPTVSKSQRKSIEDQYLQADKYAFELISKDKEDFRLKKVRETKEELSRKEEDSIRIAKEQQLENDYNIFFKNYMTQLSEDYYVYRINKLKGIEPENKDFNDSYYFTQTSVKSRIHEDFRTKTGVNLYTYPIIDDNVESELNMVNEKVINSQEYKDEKVRRDLRIKNGIAELNKAEEQYNYNMTHLEKYSTPELRKMYIYFSDKKSFQTEAELIRIELLKRK